MSRASRSRSASAASRRATRSTVDSARSPSCTTHPPTPPAMSTSTIELKVLVVRNVPRSMTSAADTGIPPARPHQRPPTTAQARTGVAAQATGSVGPPWSILVAVSIQRVLITSVIATPMSAAISHGDWPAGHR